MKERQNKVRSYSARSTPAAHFICVLIRAEEERYPEMPAVFPTAEEHLERIERECDERLVNSAWSTRFD